jgi:hypothetical protein
MTEVLPVDIGRTSPRRLLYEIGEGADGWIRLLATETIMSRQEVSSDTLNTVYEQFLAEKTSPRVTVHITPNTFVFVLPASHDEWPRLETSAFRRGR